MIDLTPLEVRKKKGDFRRQMRGYDPALVDDFLDLVADRLEQLVRDNMAAQEKLAILETQVKEFREREKALTEALGSAQELREQGRKQIEKELELARRQAEQDAEQIRASAVHAREREEQNLRRLRVRQSQVIQSFRQFLERELAELAITAETLEVTNAIDDAAEESSREIEERRPAAAPVRPPASAPASAAAVETQPAANPAPAAKPAPAASAPTPQPKTAPPSGSQNAPTPKAAGPAQPKAGGASTPPASAAAPPPVQPNAAPPPPAASTGVSGIIPPNPAVSPAADEPVLALDPDFLDISDLAPAPEEDGDDSIIDGGWVSLIENKRDVDG